MPRLFEYSAASLAKLIRSREVSSREVVEAHLARIAEVNGYLAAIAVTLSDSARAAADACDRSTGDGPLHGVPFTIKENLDCDQLQPFISEALFDHLMRLCRSSRLHEISYYRVHTERSRLARAWSRFFLEYPVVIGPNWGRPVWPIDEDLHAQAGIQLLESTVRFITPGNALGVPCVALPMGVVDGLPTGIQIYADLWREDLCLDAAESIERGVTMPAPIDPVGSSVPSAAE